MARSKEIVPGVGRLSRSQVFAKRGLYKGLKKSEKPAAAEVAKTSSVELTWIICELLRTAFNPSCLLWLISSSCL